ncbi:hypothetical protein LPJ66_002015 [Kickxella alabastrina]|uniref:Uncharacterized protein n=1 Tax=Kickxella alabastrina TaxID=61397 RepID=A0ACC1IRK9_9FUNG|nr:hypothetical protein LPJ66_002015 [Kickxella alabastrina]
MFSVAGQTPFEKVRSAGSCLCRCRRRRYHENHKELANVPKVSWRSGQQEQPSWLYRNDHDNDEQPPSYKLRVGPLYGNSHAMYSSTERSTKTIPRLIPFASNLYRAHMEMLHPRQGVAFNPWSLLLELLEDPRLLLNPRYNSKLLIAAGHLGWTTPQNVMAQRPLLAQYLLRSECLAVDAQYAKGLPDRVLFSQESADKHAAVDLTPAQLTTLCQTQWPRFIAQKYHSAMIEPITEKLQRAGNGLTSDEWNRSWLCANISMLELQSAYVKQRTVFNRRMDARDQSQRLIRGSLEHAPGLALNVVMSWGGDLPAILNPYSIIRMCCEFFADKETARRSVSQAWQMYEMLVHHNPHLPVPVFLNQTTAMPAGRYCGEQDASHSAASLLFRALGSFDSWEEATRSLETLYKGQMSDSDLNLDSDQQQQPLLTASDHKLVERFFNLKLLRRQLQPL